RGPLPLRVRGSGRGECRPVSFPNSTGSGVRSPPCRWASTRFTVHRLTSSVPSSDSGGSRLGYVPRSPAPRVRQPPSSKLPGHRRSAPPTRGRDDLLAIDMPYERGGRLHLTEGGRR